MSDKLKTPSNFFKDMDEVRAYAESIKDSVSENVYNDILFLLGLEENKALTTMVKINGEDVAIDRYIADLIKFLEDKDYKPLASCSGLQEEHQDSLHKPKQGYLAIKYLDNCFKYLSENLNIDGISVEKSECYLQPAINITVKADTDEELKDLWNRLFEFLK
ncbi:MAG: hypothetical protein E7406_01550 [Ruminococcaceae bacterium]|nr:hypothetical protein [Oscillospiraceae bacterium]